MTMNDPFSRLAAQSPRPNDSVLDSIRQTMSTDSKPRRSLSRGQRVALSALALIFGLVLTSLNALSSSPRALVLAAAALSLSVSGLLLGGLVPGQPGRIGVSTRRWLLGGLCIVAFTALALQAESFLPFGQFLHGESLSHATVCMTHSLMSGVVGATALLYFWRRTDPFTPGLTGCALGLLGGAVGTMSVSLLCENGEGFHLTIGHGIALLILASLGLLLGKRWLTP